MAIVHSSFYRFTPVADPAAFADWLREAAVGLGGVVLVAAEGLSAAVAGEAEAVQAFEAKAATLLAQADAQRALSCSLAFASE